MNKDDIIKLPVKKKVPLDSNLMLVQPPFGKCNHFKVTFEVDIDSGDCKCLQCGERVTAIYVLDQLMKEESRWNRTRKTYQDEMKRLKERARTKCQHCGEMTRISNR